MRTKPSPARQVLGILSVCLLAAACAGCAALGQAPSNTVGDQTATGGAPTVTQSNQATAAPAAQTIGGVSPIPSGR